MNKINFKGALLIASLIGFFSTGTISANNNSDTGFNFALNARLSSFTGERSKTDASSSYVKINYLSGESRVQCFILGPNGVRVQSSEPRLSSGQSAYITQQVYEKGYRTCKLGVRNTTALLRSRVSGVWSPDSI